MSSLAELSMHDLMFKVINRHLELIGHQPEYFEPAEPLLDCHIMKYYKQCFINMLLWLDIYVNKAAHACVDFDPLGFTGSSNNNNISANSWWQLNLQRLAFAMRSSSGQTFFSIRRPVTWQHENYCCTSYSSIFYKKC